MANTVFAPVMPSVDTNLFNNAARTGAAVGMAIPTPLAAGVTGAIQGYTQGQEIAQNDINLQNAQLKLEANKRAAAADAELENTRLIQEKADLENKTTKANAENKSVTETEKYWEQFKTLTPDQQADSLFSGQLPQSVIQNPGTFKNVLTQVSLNPSLSPEKRKLVNRALKRVDIDDFYSKERQKNSIKAMENRAELFEGKGSAVMSQIATKLNVPKVNTVESVEFVPEGTYKIDPKDPNKLAKDSRGNRIPLSSDERASGAYDSSRYIAVSKHPGTLNEIVASGITKDVYDLTSNYISNVRLESGLEAYLANQLVDETDALQDKASKPAAASGAASSTRISVNAPQAAPDPITARLASKLNLDESYFPIVKAPLASLQEQAKAYALNPDTRASIASKNQYDLTARTIARSISDKQFSESPALQSQYTMKDVDIYNRSILSQMAVTGGASSGINLPMSSRKGQSTSIVPNVISGGANAALLEAFKLETPSDLYYTRQQNTLFSAIDEAMDAAVNLYTKKTNAVTNSRNWSKPTTAAMEALARGAG